MVWVRDLELIGRIWESVTRRADKKRLAGAAAACFVCCVPSEDRVMSFKHIPEKTEMR